jgi:alkylation response protein AidB-like acyl-CoA dehydrogenase
MEGWPETDASQILLLEQIQNFVQQHLAPIASDLDKTGQFPTSIIQKLGEMGVLGMMVPETWGGSGVDTVSYAMTIEELAASCASTAVIVSVNNSLVCSPLLKYGNESQKSQ